MVILMGYRLELEREILMGLEWERDSEGELEFLGLDKKKKSMEKF
jgi:hypothetical protein